MSNSNNPPSELERAIQESLREQERVEQERERSNRKAQESANQSRYQEMQPQKVQAPIESPTVIAQTPSSDLNETQLGNISLFSTLVEAQAHEIAQKGYSQFNPLQLQTLFAQVSSLHAQLTASVQEAADKYKELYDMNTAIHDVVSIYDSYLQQRLLYSQAGGNRMSVPGQPSYFPGASVPVTQNPTVPYGVPPTYQPSQGHAYNATPFAGSAPMSSPSQTSPPIAPFSQPPPSGGGQFYPTQPYQSTPYPPQQQNQPAPYLSQQNQSAYPPQQNQSTYPPQQNQPSYPQQQNQPGSTYPPQNSMPNQSQVYQTGYPQQPGSSPNPLPSMPPNGGGISSSYGANPGQAPLYAPGGGNGYGMVPPNQGAATQPGYPPHQPQQPQPQQQPPHVPEAPQDAPLIEL